MSNARYVMTPYAQIGDIIHVPVHPELAESRMQIKYGEMVFTVIGIRDDGKSLVFTLFDGHRWTRKHPLSVRQKPPRLGYPRELDWPQNIEKMTRKRETGRF